MYTQASIQATLHNILQMKLEAQRSKHELSLSVRFVAFFHCIIYILINRFVLQKESANKPFKYFL